jgi:hypothetical protein
MLPELGGELNFTLLVLSENLVVVTGIEYKLTCEENVHDDSNTKDIYFAPISQIIQNFWCNISG